MACIGLVNAENSSRNNKAERGLKRHKRARFAGGRVRTQQNPVVDVEGILHIPCGVIRRKVQLCEVKIVIFDFRPFKGCEAQSNKRIADFAIYLGKRVELAGRQLDNARKGNVNGFVFNALLLCKCVKHCFSCFKCFGNGLLNLIGRFAELCAPFGREFAHCAQNSRQCAVSAQNGGVQFGQLFFAFDVLKPLKRVLTDFCKFVKHFVFLLYFFKSKKFVPQNKSSASVPEGRVRFSRGTTLFHSPKRAECIREIAFANSNSPRLPQKDFIGSDAAATTHLPRSKPAFVRE